MTTERQLELAREMIQTLQKEKEELEFQLSRERAARLVLSESNKQLEAADTKLTMQNHALTIVANYPKKQVFLRRAKNRTFVEGYNTAIDDIRAFVKRNIHK